MGRGVLFLAVALAALAACTGSVDGTGTPADGVLGAPSPTRAAATAAPRPTRPAPAPRPTRSRDPVATANQVDLRVGDLPAGWSKVPDSSGDSGDSFDWVLACVRDTGVAAGTFGGAATPDYSPDGTGYTSQVGSVTGLFGTEAAARAFVAVFRRPGFAACVGAEARRQWTGFPAALPFASAAVRVPTATEAAGIGARTTYRGRPVQIQFVPIRTGPIVTVLSTLWRPASDQPVLARAAANIGTRQRTA